MVQIQYYSLNLKTMAKGKREQEFGKENTIKCKDCKYSYDPDYSSLSADEKIPILCKCKYSKFMVFYNVIEKKCTNSKNK